MVDLFTYQAVKAVLAQLYETDSSTYRCESLPGLVRFVEGSTVPTASVALLHLGTPEETPNAFCSQRPRGGARVLRGGHGITRDSKASTLLVSQQALHSPECL